MRAIGIDYGTVRVGVAISDQLGMMAHPLQTLSNDSNLIKTLRAMVEKEKVNQIVIGLPKNMDGTLGPAAEKVKTFGNQLEQSLSPGIRVIYLDERLTTVEAQRALHAAGKDVKKSRKMIDQVAAQILLQGYLDSLAWEGGGVTEERSDAVGERSRLKLTLAYDGSHFLGWQSQPHRRSVQDHLNAALKNILNTPIKIVGAGRTDAGVHALGQVAHVDVPANQFNSKTWINAINAHLDPTIRVLHCQNVPNSFHAQYSAQSKIYQYRIWNHEVFHPMELNKAWHIPQSISMQQLQAAAQLLTGEHDFASFAANRGKPVESTIRTLYSIRIVKKAGTILISFHGNGFLYRMVRMLTGSMLHIARNRAPMEWLIQFLEQPGKQKTNHTAPAEGLYLKKVLY
jgi:tRNA pseudouridine38-40 synthase